MAMEDLSVGLVNLHIQVNAGVGNGRDEEAEGNRNGVKRSLAV